MNQSEMVKQQPIDQYMLVHQSKYKLMFALTRLTDHHHNGLKAMIIIVIKPSIFIQFQKLNTNVISAMVHNRRKKPTRPSIRSGTPEKMHERFQRRSASPDTFERAPHSELSIVDCSMEGNANHHSMSSSNAEPAIRRKLYFNPVFFETEHLKV